MSDLAQRLAGLSPAQRQLLEKRLQRGRATAEPIALIGMGCRFPGSPDLDAFWRLISECRDASREIPPDRWDIEEFFDATGEQAGKMSVRWAALIDDAAQFDPQFFGITPREAAQIDPQQRLLLEVAWETMENAGRPADQMAGTNTAAFIGIGGTDYSKVPVPYEDYYETINPHSGTGNALSIASNRLSYIFDWHGPSMSVDTACSSSSLSIHLAVESLRRRECDAALAGGVNMILSPETTIAFSKARMLSPEGKCRPFDARADGYVRGEGCGLVMLKRLAEAERDGDNVLAVIRATAVNQDGRTSGISAPNGQLQQACIRAALSQAGLAPDEIGYLEAHGTGTPLGDPIEMQALGEVFARSGPQLQPLFVTSVKANVGHMETVSGVAGLIKVVLMMGHDQIVPQTHFTELNPHIRLDGSRLAIPTEPVPWAAGGGSRIAGISSFGFGGTNTHIIVEAPEAASAGAGSGGYYADTAASIGPIPRGDTQSNGPGNGSPRAAEAADHGEAPTGVVPDAIDRPLHLLKLSAKSDTALTLQAERLLEYIDLHPEAALADIAYTANTGRSNFNRRAVIVAADRDLLQKRLAALAAGEQRVPGVKQETVRALQRPQTAFLFTGQGLQYAGMGRGLYESHPEFRATLDDCDRILREHWQGRSLLSILFPEGQDDGPAALLHQTQYTQPAMFALDLALAHLWQSWGAAPDILLGHSVGEYPAACVAGVMTLEEGLALIAERARLMQDVKRHGKMAVVFTSAERVAAALADCREQVVVAVINGPENIVISGDSDEVERLVGEFESNGIQAKLLNVSHAFHSPLMDEMLADFERFAGGIAFREPQVPLVSNLTGEVMREAPTARYWRDHLRNAVQFADGMQRIAEAEARLIIEMGPTASLLGMGRRCIPKHEAAWLPSLRAGQVDWQVLSASAAEFCVAGGTIDWRAWDRPWQRRRLPLPNYPFQRLACWLDLRPERRRLFSGNGVPALAAARGGSHHPLLGTRLSTVWHNALFEALLGPQRPAYLIDHQVQGSPVAPAAAYLEQAFAAADEAFGPGLHGIADLSIQQAMFLHEETLRRVQVTVTPETGGEATFETYSRAAGEGEYAAEENGKAAAGKAGGWMMHATGRLLHESRSASDDEGEAPGGIAIDLDAVRSRAVDVSDRESFYAQMAERGLAYGPAFQVLDELHRTPSDALARIDVPPSVRQEAAKYHLHPALGDALLQSMAGAVPLEQDGSYSPFTYMPVAVRRVRRFHTIEDFGQPLFCYAVRTSDDDRPSPETVTGDVLLLNGEGQVLVALEGVRVQRVGRAAGGAAGGDVSNWFYRVAWRPQPNEAARGSDDAQESKEPPLQQVPATGTWLILTDGRGVGAALAARLAKGGASCVLAEQSEVYSFEFATGGNGNPREGSARATLDPLVATHYERLLADACSEAAPALAGIVHLWSLDIPHPTVERELGDPAHPDFAWQAARRLGCGSALKLLRRLARTSFRASPRLWMVTRGAQAIGADQDGEAEASLDAAKQSPIAVEQAALWGLGRVAAMELADLRPTLVDLDAQQTPELAAGPLADEFEAAANTPPQAAAPPEGQIAFRGGRRYVARLVHDDQATARSDSSAEKASAPATLRVPAGTPFQLRIQNAGSLDALCFVPVDRRPPGPGQVEVAVHAAGLNFSDVLKALGLYPGIRDEIVPLGIEASGVVTAMGDGVDRFRVGQEVMGVVPYAFASHAVTAEYALVPKPAAIDHDEACTIPITFLTAYYAMVRLAQLQPGERILIHAGAGGVGLAAIQIAQHIGAEVFATAGSDEKRNFLRSLGVEHVYNSRTLEFAEQILAATDRQGVDAVLNSLPGEAITRSLSILRAYGRFLEIGKTDIYMDRKIGLLPFQDNLSYFAIDLDRMLRQRPEAIRSLFAEVMEHFEAGRFRPLMLTQFDAEQTVDAFRYMSQRKNIGKVVVSLDVQTRDAGGAGGAAAVEVETADADAASGQLVRPNGSYLISGGLGALGMRVAEWLAEHNAGAVLLLSRRPPSAEVAKQIEQLNESHTGTHVLPLQGDVTDLASLREALGKLPRELPPLRGVVHAAGVLADGMLADMDLDQLDRAMQPKVQGAWNLHTLTYDAPLDFFVLFSSVASVLGSPGQANYAAGNAMLDALAHARRAAGKPATTINWGPWAESGMAADEGRGEGIQSRGMDLLPPRRGLEALEMLLRQRATQVAVMDAHWGDLLRLLGSRRPALLEGMAAGAEDAAAPAASQVDQAFRQQLLDADGESRQALVRDYIRDELARIMGVQPDSLETDQPLSTFGLDSLLALELKNNLEGRLAFTLPMAKLMESPTIDSLAEATAALVAGGDGQQDAATEAEEAWSPLVCVREGTGDAPPLILLPGLGGDIRCYQQLIERLPHGQSAYVIRPRGIDEGLAPHQAMSEMVADYAAALQSRWPGEHFRLAGWSTGGVYAYALAQELGEAAEWIALFDTPLPSMFSTIDVDDDARFLCDIIRIANRFIGVKIDFTYEQLSQLDPETQFQTGLAEARRLGAVSPDAPEAFIRRLVEVSEANVRAIQSYRPAAVACPVHLFVPQIKGGLSEIAAQEVSEVGDLGWREEVGVEFALCEVPGDHFTMMTGAGVEALVGHMRRLL